MNVEAISEFLKVVLQIANVAILGYALFRFMNKPHDTLEEKHKALEKRLDGHDDEIREIKEAIKQGDNRMKDMDEPIEVILSCLMSLLNFELVFCLSQHYEGTEELMKAKDRLQGYLTKK